MKINASLLAGFLILVWICQVSILFTVHAPIAAWYWVRQDSILKHYFASQMHRPKIVFAGDSNVLFSVSAKEVETTLGRPAVNMGLVAPLNLDKLLQEAGDVAVPGDVIVLPLASQFYQRGCRPWEPWQLSNAIAWDREYLNRVPVWTRIALFSRLGNGPLIRDLLLAKYELARHPDAYRPRRAALAPPQEVIRKYESRQYAPGIDLEPGPYAPFSLNRNGDVPEIVESACTEPVADIKAPAAVEGPNRQLLAAFIARMKEKHVAVAFAQTPYLVQGTPPDDWEAAEIEFKRQIQSMGSIVIDNRRNLFFERNLFYDTALHMTSQGRTLRTKVIIDGLLHSGLLN